MKAKPGKVSPFADAPAGPTPDEIEADHSEADLWVQRRDERLRRFLSRCRRFARCQREARRWIAFRDIADWHASAVAADRRDQARRAEYLELAAALRKGGFDKDGRTMVLVVPAESEAFRLERNLQGRLGRGLPAADAEEVYVSAHLANAWVPWLVYRDWSSTERNRRPSPAWRLDRKEVAASKMPKMQAAAVDAYRSLFPNGVPPGMKIAARNHAIREHCGGRGFFPMQISDSTIKRALKTGL